MNNRKECNISVFKSGLESENIGITFDSSFFAA